MNTAVKTRKIIRNKKVSSSSAKPEQKKNENPGSKNGGRKAASRKNTEKTGFSMSRRISVSYTHMLIDTFLSCLILILIVYIAYNLVALGIDAKEITDSLMMSDDLSEVLLDIALQKDTEIALFDSTGETLVNTFRDFSRPHSRVPIWFYSRDGSVFIMIKSYISLSGRIYEMNIFRNITGTLVKCWSFSVFLPFCTVL